MTSYVLTPVAWESWDDLIEAATGLTWHWTDLSGARLQPGLPERPPAATHLWGWAPGRFVRLRLDTQRVHGAELHATDSVPRSDDHQVRVRKADSRTWAEHEARVGLREIDGAKLRGRTIRLLEVWEPTRLTFLEIV